MGTVYSTEHGRMCPECENPVKECSCKQASDAIPEGDGIVRVSRSTQGRKGKCVTLVTGVPLAADDLRKLAKKLKQRCGTGGTLKDGVIEIQGDHRDLLVAELEKAGYTARKSGG